ELSQISLTSGKPEAGLQYAEDAAKTLPGSPLIQLNLARNLIARREIARADPIVKQLVAKYPNEPQVHAVAGTLGIAKKDLVAARASYEKALALQPMNAEALTGLTAID